MGRVSLSEYQMLLVGRVYWLGERAAKQQQIICECYERRVCLLLCVQCCGGRAVKQVVHSSRWRRSTALTHHRFRECCFRRIVCCRRAAAAWFPCWQGCGTHSTWQLLFKCLLFPVVQHTNRV